MKLKTTNVTPTTLLSKDAAGSEPSNVPEMQIFSTKAVNRVRWFWVVVVGLTLAFAGQLWDLTRHAMVSELDSYVILIPFVSLYLIFLKRNESAKSEPRLAEGSTALAVIPLALGLVALTGWWNGTGFKDTDSLSLVVFSFVCFIWTAALMILGVKFLRPYLFAMVFLIFLVPLPTIARHGIEVFFQKTSAEAAAVMFSVSGTTVLREGLIFHFPGIILQVAEECSGIRSSLILFITSLLAGQLFLRSPSRRIVLTYFVLPLAIVRNGFRIFTIAMLCVHVDPSMVDSWVHKRGGPMFFGLSLIPFFLLLLWLRRTERLDNQKQK